MLPPGPASRGYDGPGKHGMLTAHGMTVWWLTRGPKVATVPVVSRAFLAGPASRATGCDLHHFSGLLTVTNGQPQTLTDTHGHSPPPPRPRRWVCVRRRGVTPLKQHTDFADGDGLAAQVTGSTDGAPGACVADLLHRAARVSAAVSQPHPLPERPGDDLFDVRTSARGACGLCPLNRHCHQRRRTPRIGPLPCS